MKLNIRYTYAWIFWVIAFLVIEGVAIYSKESGATLSAHLWNLFGIKYTGKYYKLMRLIGISFISWFSLHILTGGWI